MLQNLLLLILYISSLYAFIPLVISRLFGFRVLRRGKIQDSFALTFDDGPHPVYTPQLLDLLRRYKVKATFFVVGMHAKEHPEILRRMHQEGHLIGIHNYEHKANWLMRPKTVRRQIEWTEQIINQVTGQPVMYYRPPWGVVNLFDFSPSAGKRIVLWSSMFYDWRFRLGADRLAERMLRKLRGGEIMLLHDRGTTFGADPQAPENMLLAVEKLLEEAAHRGMKGIRIDEMEEAEAVMGKEMERQSDAGWLKRGILRLWFQYEKLFHSLFHLQPASKDAPLLHYRQRSYQGEELKLGDGSMLSKGDSVLELHFDNRRLYEIGASAKSTLHIAIQMIRGVEQQLPALATRIAEEPGLTNVKALYGVSMINRGAEKLGFIVEELPRGLFATASRWYLALLLLVIHPAGQRRFRKGELRAEQQRSGRETAVRATLIPKRIVMPVSILKSRYGGTSNRLSKSAEAGADYDNEIVDMESATAAQVNSTGTTA